MRPSATASSTPWLFHGYPPPPIGTFSDHAGSNRHCEFRTFLRPGAPSSGRGWKRAAIAVGVGPAGQADLTALPLRFRRTDAPQLPATTPQDYRARFSP